ncbi:MAG: hypothetical protein Q8733_01880 [Pigeon pea little leaf phytoplasma]|nr:hypothetical protein [Pigeon pea little leaf phytoplasma]MDV3163565.1 hypothetical protein [Pigeon pea little leaf phytoplasma]
MIKKQELIQLQIEDLKNHFFSNRNSLKEKEELLYQKKLMICKNNTISIKIVTKNSTKLNLILLKITKKQ